MKLFVILALVGVALSSPAKINPSLLTSLESNAVANIIVNFNGGNTEVLSSFESTIFKTRTDKLNTLKESLQRHTEKSQHEVLQFLNKKSVSFKSFWISNQLFIKGASKDLVNALAGFDNVTEVREELTLEWESPIAVEAEPVPLAEWGIERVKAEEAWQTTNGSGVVIAHIDSGVRYTHESLINQFREDYGWLDPSFGSSLPNDPLGHGTHTMGTIVGTHGIGVAPGAQWISCSACGDRACQGISEAALIACGQWMVCPTKPDGTDPDCSKAPVLVSNSWGRSGGSDYYEHITEAWIAAGIVPLFSNGNSGPSCGTAGSPADNRRVIAVGSINVQNRISSFSSVGPSRIDQRIKPEISAPGENVRSAVPDSDTAYGSKSGTSMACPHAAGVTALLFSINPDLTFGQVRQALLDGVDYDVVSQNATCSGRADDEFPNHHFGFGVINAAKVVENAKRSLV